MIGLSSLWPTRRCEDVLPAFSNHSEELLYIEVFFDNNCVTSYINVIILRNILKLNLHQLDGK